MNAITYAQFRDSVALRWTRQGYEFDEVDLDATATPALWHSQVLLPFVESGGKFPLPVCRSIAKHGEFRLTYFAKNFPQSLPENLLLCSGTLAPAKGLLS